MLCGLMPWGRRWSCDVGRRGFAEGAVFTVDLIPVLTLLMKDFRNHHAFEIGLGLGSIFSLLALVILPALSEPEHLPILPVIY